MVYSETRLKRIRLITSARLFGYNEPRLQRTLAFNVQYLGAKAVYSIITYARALLLHSRKP
jgi:hypothetical protein